MGGEILGPATPGKKPRRIRRILGNIWKKGGSKGDADGSDGGDSPPRYGLAGLDEAKSIGHHTTRSDSTGDSSNASPARMSIARWPEDPTTTMQRGTGHDDFKQLDVSKMQKHAPRVKGKIKKLKAPKQSLNIVGTSNKMRGSAELDQAVMNELFNPDFRNMNRQTPQLAPPPGMIRIPDADSRGAFRDDTFLPSGSNRKYKRYIPDSGSTEMEAVVQGRDPACELAPGGSQSWDESFWADNSKESALTNEDFHILPHLERSSVEQSSSEDRSQDDSFAPSYDESVIFDAPSRKARSHKYSNMVADYAEEARKQREAKEMRRHRIKKKMANYAPQKLFRGDDGATLESGKDKASLRSTPASQADSTTMEGSYDTATLEDELEDELSEAGFYGTGMSCRFLDELDIFRGKDQDSDFLTTLKKNMDSNRIDPELVEDFKNEVKDAVKGVVKGGSSLLRAGTQAAANYLKK